MKTLVLELQVDDYFEPGYCYDCPISYEQGYDEDGYVEYDTYCSLGCSYENCPLKVKR